MFGQVGFSTVWVEISVRVNWDSLPFRQIFAVWVEISGRRLRESLPFSRVFRRLGRDFRMAEVWWLSFAATSSPAHPFAQKIV